MLEEIGKIIEENSNFILNLGLISFLILFMIFLFLLYIFLNDKD